jgi:inner membrane protein involved in colicin E2 resistance
VYDHSASFSRSLSPDESEVLKAMADRTVSGVVPGKLFMRHWLAAEQATVSIYNRGLSAVVTMALLLWAGCYPTSGGTTESAIPMMGFAFFVYFMVVHTHMHNLYYAFFALYGIALVFGY